MGLISAAKERLGLVEKIYVGVNLNRRRMRPLPGTLIVELVDISGNTLELQILGTPKPAPRGALKFKGVAEPATLVTDGPTGKSHQAFRFPLDMPEELYPIPLPESIREKIKLGARYANIWWSCETQ